MVPFVSHSIKGKNDRQKGQESGSLGFEMGEGLTTKSRREGIILGHSTALHLTCSSGS